MNRLLSRSIPVSLLLAGCLIAQESPADPRKPLGGGAPEGGDAAEILEILGPEDLVPRTIPSALQTAFLIEDELYELQIVDDCFTLTVDGTDVTETRLTPPLFAGILGPAPETVDDFTAELASFGIQERFVLNAQQEVIATVLLERAQIGVRFEPINKDGFAGVSLDLVFSGVLSHFDVSNELGMIVTNILGDSPATRAGLKPDDIILSVDGVDVTAEQLEYGPFVGHKPGEQLALEIIRKGKKEVLRIELGRRPPRTAYPNRIYSLFESDPSSHPTDTSEEEARASSAYERWMAEAEQRLLAIEELLERIVAKIDARSRDDR
ncbi:MAG: PDZ domain-containing protein [Planctomycetota bacterium]